MRMFRIIYIRLISQIIYTHFKIFLFKSLNATRAGIEKVVLFCAKIVTFLEVRERPLLRLLKIH